MCAANFVVERIRQKTINKVQFFCAETTGTIPKHVKVESGRKENKNEKNLFYCLWCTEQLTEHQTKHKADSIRVYQPSGYTRFATSPLINHWKKWGGYQLTENLDSRAAHATVIPINRNMVSGC